MLRLFASTLLASCLLSSLAEAKRPNVIFIITDDQRRDDFGFIEHKALTPNIDRLASEGTYFENSYTCSTVCTPSRYACITGRYPSRCTAPAFLNDITPEGVTQVYFNTHLEKDRPNLPKALQAAGYTTGLVGKWHMGSHLKGSPSIPKGADPKTPAIRSLLEQQQAALCDELSQHGFDHVARAYAGNPLDSTALKNAGLAHHNMDWITEGALQFIQKNHEEPFFLYFSTTLPHSPDPVEGMETDPRSTPVGILDTPPVGMPSRQEIFQQVEEAGLPRKTAGNTWLDAGIGAILDQLEALDIADNTLIVYFNDHGMEYASKSSLYQGALRTPSMAWWPGTIQSQVLDELVSNVDIAPTILDACDAKPLPDMPLDGRSYLPLAKGTPTPWREAIYGEIGFTRAVVTREWKYLAFRLPPSQIPGPEKGMQQQLAELTKIKKDHAWVKWEVDPNAKIPHVGGPPGGNFLIRLTMAAKPPYLANYHDPDQLYDLSKDPRETTNLAKDPAHADQLDEMQALLRDFLGDLPGSLADLKPASP